MKKLAALLLIAALLCALAACGGETAEETAVLEGASAPAADGETPDAAIEESAAEDTPAAPAEGTDGLVGTWSCAEATLEIARKGAAYFCRITRPGDDGESTEWTYDCSLIGGSLSADGSGVRKNVRCGEDGAVLSSVTVYTDGSAVISRGADGALRWDDRKENAGEGLAFIYTAPAERAPGVGDLVSDFYLTVGSYHQGVAGASLSMANAACETLRFAAGHKLWCADAAALREALQEAWGGLDEPQRADFVANYLSVIDLVDDCIADWAANRGRFDDAGSGEEMTALLDDPMTVLSWGVLRDAVMGLRSTYESV